MQFENLWTIALERSPDRSRWQPGTWTGGQQGWRLENYLGSCCADWSRNGRWHWGRKEVARYEAGDNVTSGSCGWLFHQKPQHLQASWQIRSIKSSDVRRSRRQALVSSLNMWFGPVIYFLSHKNGAIETWPCYLREQLCWPAEIMNKRWFWK